MTDTLTVRHLGAWCRALQRSIYWPEKWCALEPPETPLAVALESMPDPSWWIDIAEAVGFAPAETRALVRPLLVDPVELWRDGRGLHARWCAHLDATGIRETRAGAVLHDALYPRDGAERGGAGRDAVVERVRRAVWDGLPGLTGRVEAAVKGERRAWNT